MATSRTEYRQAVVSWTAILRPAMLRPAMLLPAMLGVVATLAAGGAWAQDVPRPGPSPVVPGDLSRPMFDTSTPTYAPADGQPKAADTVVAEVNGRPITLGDVGDAIRAMPSSVRAMPFEALFLSVVDQLTRREALALRAQQLGLDADPVIRRKVKGAADQVLGNEMLYRHIRATISEQAVRARYDRDIAGRPGAEEVRLRVIMVPTEPEATALIAELRSGADFAELARRASRDTTARAGGDLGFMRQSDLNPEVGAVAFSLPAGQFNALPFRRGGAWFIVKVEERRHRRTPGFFEMRQQLTEAMVREAVPATVQRMLADVMIRKYDMNGNEETFVKEAIE